MSFPSIDQLEAAFPSAAMRIGTVADKARRNSVPYAIPRPSRGNLAEDFLLRSRPIGELRRHNTGHSSTSVDLSLSSMVFGNGAAVGRGNPLRSPSATTTTSSSRTIRPYVTHFSDSGFSSGSSFSFLPPPPPYRIPSMEATTSGTQKPAAIITLGPGAIRVGHGPMPAELIALINEQSRQQFFDQPDDQQQRTAAPPRIHRSLSDSRYGTAEPSPKFNRLSANIGDNGSNMTSPMQSLNGLHGSTVSKNSEPIGHRGSSWTHSRMSLSPSPSMSTVSCPEYPELQEKLRRLAITRDTLSLQVAVLNDQVGAQKEKIRDLESLLDTKQKMYSCEVIAADRQPAESADLANEIAELKQRFSTVQREKADAEKRLQNSQIEIEHLNASIQSLMNQHGGGQRILAAPQTNENEEMEQLRIIVQKLMADNEKKKLEINTLRSQLDERSSFRTFDENGTPRRSPSLNGVSNGTPPVLDINAQLRRLLVDDVKENMAHSSSYPTSLSANTQTAPSRTLPSAPHRTLPPSVSYLSSLSSTVPQPNSAAHLFNLATPRHHQLHHTTSLFAQPSYANGIHGPASPAARQLAAELDELRRVADGSHLSQRSADYFATSSLPRSLHSKSSSSLHLPRARFSATQSSSTIGGESLPPSGPPKTTLLQRLIGGRNETATRGKRLRPSQSVPNLFGPNVPPSDDVQSDHTESDDELCRARAPSATLSNGKFKRGRTRSTLRNIFGKLTRSSSQEIRANPAAAPFQRGSGIRSSASARVISLGAPLSGAIPIRPLAAQFCNFSRDTVCEWLTEVGFGQYVPEAERNINSGRHLLSLTNAQLEKELGMSNLLHRKKLRCLLNAIERNTSNTPEPADRFDVHQVMLWLDEIGLPQHRDIFAENMIDGQMLVSLCVQDLVEMKIVSAMNHATIARGIQFLRSVDFNPHMLVKTFNPKKSALTQCPDEVERWAHSCVVQWLKSIDLAEFTPNLIFSGVHGALIVHDPTFTAESLAEVLQIPAHKTLLRRHLTTHFNNLLGQEIISYKRELLAQPHVTHLSPALKIRLLKKGFTLGRKRGKNEVFVEPDLPVCPSDVSMALASSRSQRAFGETSNV